MGGPGSGRKSKLTPMQIEIAREIAANREASLVEIAQHFRVSRQTLARHAILSSKYSKHTEETIDRIRTMRDAGSSYVAIAHDLDMTKSAVAHLIRRYKIDPPHVPLYTDEFKARVLAESESTTCAALAKKYKMPVNTIYQWWHKSGRGPKPYQRHKPQGAFGAY